ncbi:MAG: hypothetical protein K2I16_03740 [Muribaculaceae bacterium]|nr:hypothetical protein [Muribaculaceae bacterium]
MKKNTFKVMFVIRRNQVNRDGKCSIVIRITVNGEYERLNSTLSIEPELWDSKAAKAIGRTQKILDFNKRIEEIKYILPDHYYELQKTHGYVTAEMVKNAYMGITARQSVGYISIAGALSLLVRKIFSGMFPERSQVTFLLISTLYMTT